MTLKTFYPSQGFCRFLPGIGFLGLAKNNRGELLGSIEPTCPEGKRLGIIFNPPKEG